MATIIDVIEKKGSHVFTVGPTATVLDAASLMNEHRIGAVVVVEDGRPVGMFTERDVLRRVVGDRRDPATTPVREVMTTKLVVSRSQADLDEVRSLFMERRIRHLPVVDDDGALVAMVSIGDVNAWRLNGQEVEIRYLHEYLYGTP